MSQVSQPSFSQDWFSHNIPALDAVIQFVKPTKILEIGSFEGRSSCWFIEQCFKYNTQLSLHCIDAWDLKDHNGDSTFYNRFLNNINIMKTLYPQLDFQHTKALSYQKLTALIAEGYENYFDFIYVDGSHDCPDVLLDALLAHKLVRVGGVIAFDDYLYSPEPHGQQSHYRLVKPAVDHYVNSYQRSVHVLQMLPVYQLYVQKTAQT